MADKEELWQEFVFEKANSCLRGEITWEQYQEELRIFADFIGYPYEKEEPKLIPETRQKKDKRRFL